MSAKKKTALKSKAGAAPAKIEYAGHWIEGNVWFKLGLSKTEAKMLKAVAGELFTKNTTSAEVARVLLQAALAHYDVLKPLVRSGAAYSKAEGFLILDDYFKGAVARQLAKISGPKGVAL